MDTENIEANFYPSEPQGEAVESVATPAPAPQSEGVDSAADNGVPEAYDLSFSDDEGNPIALDMEAVKEAEPVFRELGLSNDRAKQLMPVAQKFAQRTTEAAYQQVIASGAKQRAAWLSELKAHPELGGNRFQETMQLAQKGMAAMGYPEGSGLHKTLTESGLGNHPDIAAVFRRIGELAAQGVPVGRKGSVGGKAPTEHRWYSGKQG